MTMLSSRKLENYLHSNSCDPLSTAITLLVMVITVSGNANYSKAAMFLIKFHRSSSILNFSILFGTILQTNLVFRSNLFWYNPKSELNF